MEMTNNKMLPYMSQIYMHQACSSLHLDLSTPSSCMFDPGGPV